MSRLSARPLDAASFAPFGEVLAYDAAAARPVNDGRALRADAAAALSAEGGAPVLAFYRAAAQRLPLALVSFERHPHSTQAFVSMTARRFLIVVAPDGADGLPDLDRARAFIGGPGQGVNYRPKVWHAPLVALDADGDFLMFMWERGTGEDCVVHRLSASVDVADHTQPPGP